MTLFHSDILYIHNIAPVVSEKMIQSHIVKKSNVLYYVSFSSWQQAATRTPWVCLHRTMQSYTDIPLNGYQKQQSHINAMLHLGKYVLPLITTNQHSQNAIIKQEYCFWYLCWLIQSGNVPCKQTQFQRRERLYPWILLYGNKDPIRALFSLGKNKCSIHIQVNKTVNGTDCYGRFLVNGKKSFASYSPL